MDVNVVLTAVTCATCGVVFGTSEHHRRSLEKTGKDFFCPNGHGNCYKNKQRSDEEMALIHKNEQLEAKLAEMQGSKE